MTREERKKAIEVLDDMKVKIDIPKAAKTQNDRNWALDIAIKALSQEPCKDTISREDVIKLVECSGYDLQFRTDNADMCDDVRKLPPVTPSRQWIPVSERLPEDNQRVIVTTYGTYENEVIMSTYLGNNIGFTCGLVKAWMPKPEPYKAEMESEK